MRDASLSRCADIAAFASEYSYNCRIDTKQYTGLGVTKGLSNLTVAIHLDRSELVQQAPHYARDFSRCTLIQQSTSAIDRTKAKVVIEQWRQYYNAICSELEP